MQDHVGFSEPDHLRDEADHYELIICLVGRTVDACTIVSRITYCYHSCADQLLISL